MQIEQALIELTAAMAKAGCMNSNHSLILVVPDKLKIAADLQRRMIRQFPTNKSVDDFVFETGFGSVRIYELDDGNCMYKTNGY